MYATSVTASQEQEQQAANVTPAAPTGLALLADQVVTPAPPAVVASTPAQTAAAVLLLLSPSAYTAAERVVVPMAPAAAGHHTTPHPCLVTPMAQQLQAGCGAAATTEEGGIERMVHEHKSLENSKKQEPG